ncbi:MAG: hypothetical protein R3B57_03250 [Phycisphaerales bacterium]
MTPKNITLSIIAIACVVGAVVVTILSRGGPGETESLDRLTMWVCRDPACGAEFTLTVGAMAKQEGPDFEGRITCPECGGKNTARAQPCHNCGRYLELWGHGTLPPQCPYCGHQVLVAHGDSTHTHGPMTPPLEEGP